MTAKRKSHTTSTKCQYQAAASKPKCFSGVNWPLIAVSYTHLTLPTITWKPWKPVAMKKTDG